MNIVVEWNGTDVPAELKELPAGRYVIEAVDDLQPLTPEEEQGLADALRSLGEGRGLDLETTETRLAQRRRR